MKTKALVLSRAGASRPYAASRPLSVQELDLDPPGPGELLLRVEAAGVCHSDLSVVDGSVPRPLPIVLGHEASGVVEQVGVGVQGVGVGDHVVVTFVSACGTCGECAGGRPALCSAAARARTEGVMLGGGHRLRRDGHPVHHQLGVSAFAELAVVTRSAAVVIPPDVPLTTAALFGCALLTGAGAVLSTAAVRAGESVAVVGLGGVGMAAVMAAVAAGASLVAGIDPVEAKRRLALELGATLVAPPEEAEATLAAPVEHAIEAAGRIEALELAYRLTRRGGTTVAIGLPEPGAELRLAASSLVSEGRTVVGSFMGSAWPQRDVPRLLRMWMAGRLPVERLISRTLPLDQANEALDALADAAVVRQLLVARPN